MSPEEKALLAAETLASRRYRNEDIWTVEKCVRISFIHPDTAQFRSRTAESGEEIRVRGGPLLMLTPDEAYAVSKRHPQGVALSLGDEDRRGTQRLNQDQGPDQRPASSRLQDIETRLKVIEQRLGIIPPGAEQG